MKGEKPKIKLPDPILDALNLFKEQVADIRKIFNFMITVIIGVMLIGFVTLFFMTIQIAIDAWQFKSSVSKEAQQLKIQEKNIQNTVTQQSLIIEELDSIKEEIKTIKK